MTPDQIGSMLEALLTIAVPEGYLSVYRERHDTVIDHTYRAVTISPDGVDVSTFTFGAPGAYAHISVNTNGDAYTVGIFATDVACNVQSAGHVVAFTSAQDAVQCALDEIDRHVTRQGSGRRVTDDHGTDDTHRA